MFAVVLTLCTYAACNGYFIDSSKVEADCPSLAVVQAKRIEKVWYDNKGLSSYLKEFHVKESVSALDSYDVTCEFIPDADIP